MITHGTSPLNGFEVRQGTGPSSLMAAGKQPHPVYHFLHLLMPDKRILWQPCDEFTGPQGGGFATRQDHGNTIPLLKLLSTLSWAFRLWGASVMKQTSRTPSLSPHAPILVSRILNEETLLSIYSATDLHIRNGAETASQEVQSPAWLKACRFLRCCSWPGPQHCLHSSPCSDHTCHH